MSSQPERVSDGELAELVAQLDGADHIAVEEVKATLKEEGSRPLGLLLERAPAFGRLGKLCAIELFEHIGDPRASVVLVPMLLDEDETVEEYAARALGDLRVREAVEPLRATYERMRARGTPLDWSGPEAVRWALTALGVRADVIPPLVAARARTVDPIGQAWPIGDLAEVIEELASAQQRILYVGVYTRDAGAYGWRVDVDVEWPELDVSLPWPRLVAEAREAALDIATHPRVPADAYATVEWIDRSDA
jgi:hypothetical protein